MLYLTPQHALNPQATIPLLQNIVCAQAHFEHHGVNLTHQQEKLDLLATLGLDLFITGMLSQVSGHLAGACCGSVHQLVQCCCSQDAAAMLV